MKNNRILPVIAVLLCTVPGYAQKGLSLQECRNSAIEYNADVRSAALDVCSAQAQKNEALSMYFPSVSVAAVGYKTMEPLVNIGLKDVLGSSDLAAQMNYYAGVIAPMYGLKTSWTAFDYGYTASALVMQPVFAGGRIINGNALAAVGVEAAGHKQEIVRRDVSEAVDVKYWMIVSLQDKMETVDDALEMMAVLSGNVRAAFEAGLALDSDTLKVCRERNKLLLDRRRLENGITLAKTELFNYIGMQGENPDSVRLTDPLLPLEGPWAYYRDSEEIAAQTSESRLLDLQVEAAALQKKMVLGEALPQIAVGMSYGYGRVVGDPSWNGVTFATVSIPITDWWKTGAKVRRQENERQKALNQKDYLGKSLTLKAMALWSNVENSWEALRIARENVEIDALAARRTQDLYEVGCATLSDLLLSQVELRQSRSSLVDAEIDYRNAVTEYLSMDR